MPNTRRNSWSCWDTAPGSLRAHRLPLAVPPAVPEISTHFVAFHPAAKGEHVARFGADDDVMHVDRAFDSARLVRSLEMSAELRPILFDLEVLRGSPTVGILRVNRPFACDVVGRLLRRRLLRARNTANHN